jgi:Zn-finger nucleic acid-binding protein
MKTVDRMGIHIDQCEGCRGIFLDRGELEQIVGAEQRYSAVPAAPPPPYQPDPRYQGGGHRDSPAPYRGGGYSDSPRPYRGGHGDSPPPYGGHGGHGGYGHKRKRRSFLEELFD